MKHFGFNLEGPAGGGGACLTMQILQNGDKVDSRPAPPAGVRRILWATGIFWEPMLLLLVAKLVIWHLHFGVLGDPEMILWHLGAQGRHTF